MVAALFAIASLGRFQPAVAVGDGMTLRVRVYVDAGIDPATVEGAREVARRLLQAAGVDMTWRLCDPPAACARGTNPAGEVVLILSRRPLSGRDENCGRAAVGTTPLHSSIQVSVSCVEGVAARLAASRCGLRHPSLAMPRHDDLVGAVIAHELGHVLGLRHGRGLMRARLDPEDLIALRLGTLAFVPADAARLRLLLAAVAATAERASPDDRSPIVTPVR